MQVNDYQENYNAGWIKLYRSLKNKSWFMKSEFVHIWIYLLIEANHKGKEFIFHGNPIKLNPGQLVTGRKKISKELGINESKVERILKFFEKKECQIEQRTDRQKRVITILNWGQYQNSEQRVNNDRTTSEQRVNTNKNVKNDNNEKKKELVQNFAKQNPAAVGVVKTFIGTLDENSRYIPRTYTQKLKWLKVAQWAIDRMGEYGEEKVIDIIEYFRSGAADNNGYSWIENFQSLLKLQKKNKEDIYYLDYFWEKSKKEFVYGKNK